MRAILPNERRTLGRFPWLWAVDAKSAALLHALAFRPYAAVVALSLLCCALFLPGIATLPVTDRDEARFAQASKQMVETGRHHRHPPSGQAALQKTRGDILAAGCGCDPRHKSGRHAERHLGLSNALISWRARCGSSNLLGRPRNPRSRTRLDCICAFRDDTHAFIRGAHCKGGCCVDGKHHAFARRAVSPLSSAGESCDPWAGGVVLVRTWSRHPHQRTRRA